MKSFYPFGFRSMNFCLTIKTYLQISRCSFEVDFEQHWLPIKNCILLYSNDVSILLNRLKFLEAKEISLITK